MWHISEVESGRLVRSRSCGRDVRTPRQAVTRDITASSLSMSYGFVINGGDYSHVQVPADKASVEFLDEFGHQLGHVLRGERSTMLDPFVAASFVVFET